MMYTRTMQRRFVTLIEMMIVMFLIALITGVVAYNYRGSLDEGKAFKTRAAIEKIETILNLAAAKDPNLSNDIVGQWQKVVETSPLVHDPKALLKDGWGGDFQVGFDDQGTIHVTSQKFEDYKKSHVSMFND